jgi:mRNA-degrading endonuclease RelE of RelBE toxin-antitoxin system
MNVIFTEHFKRQYKKLSINLKLKFTKKLEIFYKNINDPKLKFHKLNSNIKNLYSFSLDYQNRVVIEKGSNGYIFHSIGNHSIYNFIN